MPVLRLAGAHHASCPKREFPHPAVHCQCDWLDVRDALAWASVTVMRPTDRLALYHYKVPRPSDMNDLEHGLVRAIDAEYEAMVPARERARL